MLTRRHFLSVALPAVAVAGCSRAEPVSKTKDSAAPAAGSAASKSGARLRLAVMHLPGALCDVGKRVGLERGFFAAEGLDVDLLPPDIQAAEHRHGLFEWLVAPTGRVRADVTLVEYPGLLDLASGASNYYVVAGEHSGCRQLVVPAQSPVQGLADLSGKRIGIASISDPVMWEYLLRQAGVAAESVHWESTVYADSLAELALVKQEFAASRLDAYVALDPVGEILKGEGLVRHLASNTWTSPLNGWYCCMIAVRRDLLDAHPEVGGALVRAWRQSVAFIERNPEEAVALSVAKGYMPPDTRQDVCARLLKEYVWMGTDHIEEDLERFFRLLIEARRLPATPPPRELVKRVYRNPEA